MQTESGWTDRFSRAERAGFCAFAGSLLLVLSAPGYAAWPLALFLLLCMAAPFFPCSGFFLPVICRGGSGSTGVALTFDDGPYPESTPFILDLLARHNLQATFFIVGRQAQRHPHLVERIVAEGHGVGNHSLRHDMLLMFRLPDRLEADISATRAVLRKLGADTNLFRPPAGIIGPRLGAVAGRGGLQVVNYNRRALDGGNRWVDGLARKITKSLRSGDIIMLHDLPPRGGEQAMQCWRKELEQLCLQLEQEFCVCPLEHFPGFQVHSPARE
jgi:peptidoglycan/xylan/chitin deacetylase (PgdA/CDA1 family)